MSKQYKLLKESKRLCWEDRLLHKNSKVRYAANIDLKFLCDSIADPRDHRLVELGNIFKKTITDSNALVQDKALDALIAYLKAADANVAGRYANEVCDAVMTKCLAGQPNTVEKAQMVFMLWVELEAVDAFLDAMEKAVTSQVARAILLAIDFMIQVLCEFGIEIAPSNRIAKMLLEILDHQDQNVLASSKGLTRELCRWLGMNPIKSVLYEKMSDTMKEELDVELPIVKVAIRAPRRLRSEPKVCGFLSLLINGTRSGPSEESAAEIPLGKDEYELVDPVDILTPLEKSGFCNKVKSRKWTKRKEAVAKLTELASTKRIAPGDYTELCCTLKKLITDQSILVRVEAVRAIGNLALELKVNFSRCSHILLPVLLANLREKKPIMTEALTNTLQAIHKAGCVALANILTGGLPSLKLSLHSCSLPGSMNATQVSFWGGRLHFREVGEQICKFGKPQGAYLQISLFNMDIDVKTAVKSEDPHVCSRTLNWLVYCIESSSKAVILNVRKDYDQICLECLNDGTAEVRDAAFSVLAAIKKSVGIGLLDMPLEKLYDVRRKKFSERKIGFSGGGAMKHGIMKQGVSRGRFLKPSEMTSQLKNAAWREPLKEVNQLQKMSLSDPKEQNKKNIDGEDGYYQFQKSFPPWWHGDNYFERLSSKERMAAEWCTKCGILDDMCRCKRHSRLPNMELPPSLLSPSSRMEVPPIPYSPYGSIVSIPKSEVYEDGKNDTPFPSWLDPWNRYE
ncbi:protein MOR1 isoform X1 [Tanacetum coccineum]